MLKISDEDKAKFLNNPKHVTLEFYDNTGRMVDRLTDSSIYRESLSYEQSMCEEETLTFGKISSAMFRIKVNQVAKPYKNLWVVPIISVENISFKLGKFKVEDDSLSHDRQYREILSYDKLYSLSKTDVADFFNGLTFPIKVKNFRAQLFSYLGLELASEVVLANDERFIKKPNDLDSINVFELIQLICEINACFGFLNNEDKFVFQELSTLQDGLFPRNDLYPNDYTYPKSEVDECYTTSDYYPKSTWYEDYDFQRITGVQISNENYRVFVGTEDNIYYISDNILLNGMVASELEDIADEFLEKVADITYTPAQVSVEGRIWMNLGDYIRVINNDGTFVMPILSRRLTGIQAMKDTYVARGKEYYDNPSSQSSKGVSVSLKGKDTVMNRAITKVIEDVNGLSIEVSGKVGEKELISKINISPDAIRLEGNRLIVDSTQFTLDENGNAVFKGIVQGASFQSKNRTVLSEDEPGIFIGAEQYVDEYTNKVTEFDGFDYCCEGQTDRGHDFIGHVRMDRHGFSIYDSNGATVMSIDFSSSYGSNPYFGQNIACANGIFGNLAVDGNIYVDEETTGATRDVTISGTKLHFVNGIFTGIN